MNTCAGRNELAQQVHAFGGAQVSAFTLFLLRA